MKALVISFVCIAIIIIGWGIFVNFSDDHIHGLINTVEDELMVSVNAEDWGKASEQIDQFSERWHKHKKVYTFFYDTADLRDAEFTIAKVEYYIKAKDLSLASGELALIKEQLGYLHLNELITIDNVF